MYSPVRSLRPLAGIALLLVGITLAGSLSTGCRIRPRLRSRSIPPEQAHAQFCANFPAEQVSDAVGTPVALQPYDPKAVPPGTTGTMGRRFCSYTATTGATGTTPRVTISSLSIAITARTMEEYKEKLKGDAVYAEDVPGISSDGALWVADRGWLFVRDNGDTYKVEGEPTLTLEQAKAALLGEIRAVPQ